MLYTPRDMAEWNLQQLVRQLKLQGVSKDDLRDAFLAVLEGLK